MNLDLEISEKDFQRKILELAKTFGWKVAHFRAAQNARGIWMTPVGADGAGWPDLILVHPMRNIIVARELKKQKGRVDPDQERWGAWLTAVGVDWKIWRPSDWDEIVGFLGGGRVTAR